MSNRWVIPGLFKVFAAFIQWDRERDLLHHEGTTFFQNQPEKPVQLRWTSTRRSACRAIHSGCFSTLVAQAALPILSNWQIRAAGSWLK